LHNGESLEAIVIEMCMQNRCGRLVLYREYNWLVLYREYNHTYDTRKRYWILSCAQKRVYLCVLFFF